MGWRAGAVGGEGSREIVHYEKGGGGGARKTKHCVPTVAPAPSPNSPSK